MTDEYFIDPNEKDSLQIIRVIEDKQTILTELDQITISIGDQIGIERKDYLIRVYRKINKVWELILQVIDFSKL